jgi:hypothetical protein
MRSLITAVVCVLAVPASAGIEHTILHGVSVGRVRVGVNHDQLPDLTEERIHSLVESRLTAASITIVPDAPATLWVIATVVRGESPAWVVQLDVRLMEEARLERNGHRLPATSWHRGAMVIAASSAECTQAVTEGLQRVADDFIEMHKAMNPKS